MRIQAQASPAWWKLLLHHAAVDNIFASCRLDVKRQRICEPIWADG